MYYMYMIPLTFRKQVFIIVRPIQIQIYLLPLQHNPAERHRSRSSYATAVFTLEVGAIKNKKKVTVITLALKHLKQFDIFRIL